jgi:PAS domain S-box-containing protein
MLDVPITYKGDVIGVLCVESLKQRVWVEDEINFTQMLSALYSFTYSVKENYIVTKNIKDIESFVDHSVLVSKADKYGKITYVNKKFEDVSGWKLKDAMGKDHNIVNSGYHPKEYWRKMYEIVVKKKKIWNDVVTNKTKNGDLYWVDSYIKAEFDPTTDELIGFMSIRYDVTELMKKTQEIEKKNTYLEHAAKILRHDMHSGINTYIPRGISSLERRLNEEDIKRLKIESPLRMIKEGLLHSQKVYRGVFEFTNLVKKDVVLNKVECDLKKILESYLSTTAYKSQVKIDSLTTIEVNEPLFCTAIDNLIRNGLKYNDSDSKFVHIYIEDCNLVVQDNGRGLTQEEFNMLSQPYKRKEGQKESGTGLGLNICLAILNEHKFNVSCEKNNIGTKIKIKLN